MAKTFAILASLSFFVLTVICVPAKERNDPSLEIIKLEDAEEGFGYQVKGHEEERRFLESLVCDDPKTPDNTVTTVSGMPPHMGSHVRVKCDEGTHFVDSDKTEVNVTCVPLPNPCMCMAAWQTMSDFRLMYNFTCTSESLVCDDPKTPDNTVTTVSGMPPHMSSHVRVKCDEGTHFVDSDKTEVNVTCVPLPNPCMCMAAWQTMSDFRLMYNFTCTSESLVCDDPKTPDNTVTTVSGMPPHMSSQVRVTCDEGTHFVDSDKTEVTVRCDPLPHPCMCMAAWETMGDYMLMYNFTCTSDRIQNEIQTKETYEGRTGREFPEEETQQEVNIPDNQISIKDTESESETEEFLPEEDLDGTIFEYDGDEEQSDIEVNIEVIDEHSDTNVIEENTFAISNELIDTNDEETANQEHETETELQEEEAEEEDEESHGSNNEEEIEEISEEESDPEESYEIIESQYDQNEVKNYESEDEAEMEENAEESEETNIEEKETEEEVSEEHNEEELEEYEENNEEAFETEHVEDGDEREDEMGSEENEAESERNAWYEEGLHENEEEEGEYIKSPSIIYTAIAELTKYDEDTENTEVVDDNQPEIVEAPEELNTVQTSPVEATDDAVITEEGDVCSLSPQSGPCKAYFRRYFFNSKSGECQLFIYGGCNGNANNFNTYDECHSTCITRQHL